MFVFSFSQLKHQENQKHHSDSYVDTERGGKEVGNQEGGDYTAPGEL